MKIGHTHLGIPKITERFISLLDPHKKKKKGFEAK